jgi:hypothetical protein
MRIETVLIILKKIETQRQLLHLQEGNSLAGSPLEKILDLINRAECHLRELEKL